MLEDAGPSSVEDSVEEKKRMEMALKPVVETVPEITAVYVFGSRATGRAKEASDVDLALLLTPDPGLDFDLLGFIVDAERALGKSVDVVILNRVSEHLRYLVRRDGILVFDRDPEVRKPFERIGRKAYEDFLHMHRRYVKRMREDLSHGR